MKNAVFFFFSLNKISQNPHNFVRKQGCLDLLLLEFTTEGPSQQHMLHLRLFT